MDIKVGGVYKCRNGKIATIYGTDARGAFPVFGLVKNELNDKARHWNRDGLCFNDGRSESEDDLVELIEAVPANKTEAGQCRSKSNVVSIASRISSPLEMPESLTLLELACRWKVWVKTGSVCFHSSDDQYFYAPVTMAFIEDGRQVHAYQKADGERGHIYNWTASTGASNDADNTLVETLFQGAWEDD